MSSILNSISQGDFQVQQVPKKTPDNQKNRPLLNCYTNSEIEFKTCPKLNDAILDDVNTGFSENNDLHFKNHCKKPSLITPLYKENYLAEFKTEEEKASARHALGIYNKNDIVAMSLLTAEETLPTSDAWNKASIKQLKQGDKFFTPITSIHAVYDSDGTTLSAKLKDINSTITQHHTELTSIIQVSKNKEISSLGDVKAFLQGFNNGDNLYNKLDEINQEMLRFEKTGQIS